MRAGTFDRKMWLEFVWTSTWGVQQGCKVREGREFNEGKESKESVCACVIRQEKRLLLFFMFAVTALVIRSTKVTWGRPIYLTLSKKKSHLFLPIKLHFFSSLALPVCSLLISVSLSHFFSAADKGFISLPLKTEAQQTVIMFWRLQQLQLTHNLPCLGRLLSEGKKHSCLLFLPLSFPFILSHLVNIWSERWHTSNF